ncbi:hypothetical protein FACS1894140_1870 [Spirochaetia bacterium]|nr:hypothetical protein FACS1894140_1870 [Spirochaetia bacterium]
MVVTLLMLFCMNDAKGSDKGDIDKAIEEYTQAISIDPNDADAYLNRGNAYYDKGDYDRVITD